MDSLKSLIQLTKLKNMYFVLFVIPILTHSLDPQWSLSTAFETYIKRPWIIFQVYGFIYFQLAKFPYGLAVRVPGFHPGDLSLILGMRTYL